MRETLRPICTRFPISITATEFRGVVIPLKLRMPVSFYGCQ